MYRWVEFNGYGRFVQRGGEETQLNCLAGAGAGSDEEPYAEQFAAKAALTGRLCLGGNNKERRTPSGQMK